MHYTEGGLVAEGGGVREMKLPLKWSVVNQKSRAESRSSGNMPDSAGQKYNNKS